MSTTNPLDFLKNISNQTLFYYLLVIIFFIYFFTTVLDTGISHLLAFIVIIIFILLTTQTINSDVDSENIDLEFKFDSLGDSTFIPSWIYLDADLVELFYNVKQDLYSYNTTAYIRSLKACDNLLKIRKDFELELCKTPTVPDLQQNFDPMKPSSNSIDYNLQEDQTNCKEMLVNAYPNYTIAKEQLKNCMNEMQSLIVTLPSDTPVLDYKHKTVCDRLHILLKRNLDIIYNIYQSKKKIYDTHITDYDMQIPYNEATGMWGDIISNSFNFY
jgi:hypothetical protein